MSRLPPHEDNLVSLPHHHYGAEMCGLHDLVCGRQLFNALESTNFFP